MVIITLLYKFKRINGLNSMTPVYQPLILHKFKNNVLEVRPVRMKVGIQVKHLVQMLIFLYMKKY